MGEHVVKYTAIFLIVLSGVTFIYTRHHNVSIVLTSSISCTSGCKQDPTAAADKKASPLQKRCVCETCFCHLLHQMIRFLKPVINYLRSIIDSSDVYLATLQEKCEELFRYTLNQLNQCSSSMKAKFVDGQKENFTFVPQEKCLELNNSHGVKTRDIREDALHSFTKNCKDIIKKCEQETNAQMTEKKTCAKCEQRGVKCVPTCPRRAQQTENVQNSDAAKEEALTSAGGVTSKVDCDNCQVKGVTCPENCLKATVDSILSTSNRAKCKHCASKNVACREGCPGEEICNKK